MADNVSFAKFVIPTGYESEQEKIALKQRIAQALLERGLQQQQGMRSPFEVLGQLANAYAGKRLESQAEQLQTDLGQKIRGDYAARKAAFDNAVASGMSNSDITKNFGDDPFLQSDVKPYQDAMAKALSEKENIVRTPTTYARQGDLIGKPIFDPNAAVVPTGNPGEYGVNTAKAIAGMAANPNLTNPMELPQTIRDPYASPGGAVPGAVPSPAPGIDTSQLTPQEQQILRQEIARRQSLPGSVSGMHGPGGTTPPPSGILSSGKPYWMINGQPFDNPEGR